MKFFKTPSREVRCVGEKGDLDGDQSFLIKNDWVEITKEEMKILTTPTLTEEEIKNNRKNEIISRLKEIDNEAIRPTKSIKVAELQNLSPDEFDKNKLIELENEAKTLREELATLS